MKNVISRQTGLVSKGASGEFDAVQADGREEGRKERKNKYIACIHQSQSQSRHQH